MCYNSCPYAKSFSGECNNPTKNSRDPKAYCFEGFVCSKCDTVFHDETDEWSDGICIDCASEDDLKKCPHCDYISEKCERENVHGTETGICPDCGEKI